MAQIPQSENLLQQIGQITPTSPVATAQMETQATSAIGQLGGALVKESTSLYDKANQKKAIQQAYEDASQGRFNTLSGLTNADEAYNKVMQNLAPSILVSKAGEQLQGLYNTIKSSPNFNPTTATQQYADGAKGIIDAYLHESVPEQWRAQVDLTLHKQAMQYGAQMADDALQSHIRMQTFTSLQSQNDLLKQITQASSIGNYNLANDLLTNRNNIIEQGVVAGMISPFQAQSLKKEGSDELRLQQSLRSGVPIKDDPELESKRLSLLNQRQKEIEQSQLQNHFDFNQYILNKVAGNDMPYKGMLTDEQIIVDQQATRANNYFKIARGLTQEQQNNLFTDPNFMSLPSGMQNMVRSNLSEMVKTKKANDFTSLGLDENTPFAVRLSEGFKNGLKPDQLLTKAEQNQFQLEFIANPSVAYNNLVQKTTPQFAEYYSKQLAFKADKPNPALIIPSAKKDNDYMAGLSIDGGAPVFNKKQAPEMHEALSNPLIPSATNLAIVNRIGVALKANPLNDYDTAFKQRYVSDNGILEVGDEKIRYPNNAQLLAKKMANDTMKINQIANIIENGTVFPDYQNNKYVFIKDGEKINVHFNEVGSLSTQKIGSNVITEGVEKIFERSRGIW